MRRLWFGVLALTHIACQADETITAVDEGPPIPPPGPHFTISPLPLDVIARITPVGSNNKVFPVAHTYWSTCDRAGVLPTNLPCVLEHLPLRSPGDGVVLSLSAGDGHISVEGPPGLIFTFSHVTPEPDLVVGSQVSAGQTIATMYYDHSFDFGLINYGVTHDVIVPERYPEPSLHGEHPIAQFPEPLRSQLLDRVNSVSDPYGRLSYDVEGTASGGWFIEGSPRTNEAFEAGNIHMQLWLGRYAERQETRILTVGDLWPGMVQRFHVLDAGAPSWEEITPASGPVSLKLWNITEDALPNESFPMGTLLVQVLDGNQLEIEWFDTHDTVDAFTSAARIYER